MPLEPRPSWLKSQENAALAEARTRAFLLERFWVLERSVDIEGADFLVQRRLTPRSLLDPSPPRFGKVQAKFYSSPKTTHYIAEEYFLNPHGEPRPDFFLMCHTGSEDSKRAFMLTSADIKGNFVRAEPEDSRPPRYVLSGSKLLVQRFEVFDQRRVLTQMETALRNTDFHANRAFLSWVLPHREEAQEPILEMYEEVIDTWWESIPPAFAEARERARRARWELEEALNKLREMEESGNPERVSQIAEELQHEYGGRISLPHELWNEDLFRATQHHKKRFKQLRESGLLGAHAALRRRIIEYAVTDILSRSPMERDDVYLLKLTYEPSTLLDVKLDSRIVKRQKLWSSGPSKDRWSLYGDIPGLLTSSPGQIEWFIPGQFLPNHTDKGPSEEKIRGVVDGNVGKLLIAVLDHRFGEYVAEDFT